MIGQTLGGEALKAWQWIEMVDEGQTIRSASRELVLPLKAGGDEAIEVTALAVGDAVFVGLPGEIFVEIGLDIAARAGGDSVFALTIGNGYVGYIATRIAYEQGGYESGASRFVPGCGEALADAAVEVIEATA
jgi:hypothetical protein